jgi:hypothetical protein
MNGVPPGAGTTGDRPQQAPAIAVPTITIAGHITRLPAGTAPPSSASSLKNDRRVLPVGTNLPRDDA